MSNAEPALFRALPTLQGRVPWMPLGEFPTRVERVRGLTSDAIELWVKRDDESGVAYGGNKVRKLEFILAAARAAGAERLVTLGGIGSHHVLATAIYGARAGFAVDAIVFPQPMNEHVREQMLADAAAGATLHPTRTIAGVPLQALRLRRKAAWIASGGSSPTGTLGYVSAACELAEQVRAGALPPPDVIYVALGSCGTAAGLIVGLALTKLQARLVGVRVVDRAVSNARSTRRLATKTARLLSDLTRVSIDLTRVSFSVEHRFFGGAYGRATPAGEAAVAKARACGLALEPTYTGKAMAALLHDAAGGALDGKRVLFWHTYSSVDLAPLIARATPDALPAPLRRYFEGVS